VTDHWRPEVRETPNAPHRESHPAWRAERRTNVQTNRRSSGQTNLPQEVLPGKFLFLKPISENGPMVRCPWHLCVGWAQGKGCRSTVVEDIYAPLQRTLPMLDYARCRRHIKTIQRQLSCKN
jgi:hypothetical protein